MFYLSMTRYGRNESEEEISSNPNGGHSIDSAVNNLETWVKGSLRVEGSFAEGRIYKINDSEKYKLVGRVGYKYNFYGS